MSRNLLLKNEKLKFEMTNETYLLLDSKYGSAGRVINSMMYGIRAFEEYENKPDSFGEDGMINNSLKVLSASCITRELEVEELKENLTTDQLVSDVVKLAANIYFDYRGIETSKSENVNSEKK